MKRTLVLGTVFTTVLVAALPFVGGGGPSFLSPAHAAGEVSMRPVAATSLVAAGVETAERPAVIADAATAAVRSTVQTVVAVDAPQPALNTDSEHVAQKPPPPPPPPPAATGGRGGGSGSPAAAQQRREARAAQGLSCPGNVGGGPGGAPGITSAGGVGGTTSGDLASFAAAYNAIRVANCLYPIPMSNFRYDSCMEARLFWMAEDPSTDPSSAWGHSGSVRSDGVPAVGCDGNLAGGSGNSGATVAQKWWNSSGHRASLYRPQITGPVNGVCIYFAMTHGGVPNEPYSFTRAAARWGGC
jgi:hypothetical protein